MDIASELCLASFPTLLSYPSLIWLLILVFILAADRLLTLFFFSSLELEPYLYQPNARYSFLKYTLHMLFVTNLLACLRPKLGYIT